MKIFQNVLSVETLNNIKTEITSKKNQNCWCSSGLVWDKSVLQNIEGECLFSFLSDELNKKIEIDIKSYLPEYTELIIQLYIWTKNSGISLHSDHHPNRNFAATIYLNETWNLTDGGLFVWKNKNATEEIFNLISPKFNQMILNDEFEPHMVTPISPLVQDYRYTIQIFGIKN